MITIGQVCSVFEGIAPIQLQEDYDNAGLIIGDKSLECNGLIFCLDVTEAVVQQAIDEKCNMIVAHHPFIFRGLKKISATNIQGRIIAMAIKNDVSIYACHTNIDNVLTGVNGKIADKLGLVNRKILLPKPGIIQKLVVYVPKSHTKELEMALFDAGAGKVGKYETCSFVSEGIGGFKPGDEANPFSGNIGERHTEIENKLEVIFPGWIRQKVIAAMQNAHPYEEIAYEITTLNNEHQGVGSGLIGNLSEPMEEADLLNMLKKVFKVPVVRHSALLGKKLSKIAICGGSGSFLIQKALSEGADILITADLKYHDFFEAENRMILADIGHFESEQYTIELFMDIFKENFPTFAHLKNHISTNPVNYSI